MNKKRIALIIGLILLVIIVVSSAIFLIKRNKPVNTEISQSGKSLGVQTSSEGKKLTRSEQYKQDFLDAEVGYMKRPHFEGCTAEREVEIRNFMGKNVFLSDDGRLVAWYPGDGSPHSRGWFALFEEERRWKPGLRNDQQPKRIC